MGLKKPLLELTIVSAQFAVKLSREADDSLFVSDVGLTKSACGHSSDGFVRADNDHFGSFMSG